MLDLAAANLTYVAYRLCISGALVRLCLKRMRYPWAVLVMSQASFVYDTVIFGWYFSAQALPSAMEFIISDVLYTLRVVMAWAFIYYFWSRVRLNYWLSIFIVAEATFFMDLLIFQDLYK